MPAAIPDTSAAPAPAHPWYVAHTRPRAEKKLAGFCAEKGFEARLALYRSVKRYRGKRLVFLKPLFPGYVFLRLGPAGTPVVRQNRHVANLLDVADQAGFEAQLADIFRALETELEVRVAPEIRPGIRVRIRSGPLRGMDAWVESRHRMSEVQLRLDFIGQAALVKVDADDLEPA
jgi:transcription antitermination factor NusG